jgi:DNA-binding NarL/FixJ family response regulator
MCADDHAFLIEGLRARLATEPNMEFVGAVQTLEGLPAELDRLHPDVLLLDLEIPGPDVFQVIAEQTRRRTGVFIIVLSGHVRDRYIDSAVAAGARGYLSKSEDPAVLIDAIRRAARGEFVFSSTVALRVQMRPAPDSPSAASPASRYQSLTTREQQILRLIGQGQSRTEIAAVIHRSPKTVDAHRASIMEKLGIHDRVELARYAIREGLVEV